MKKNSFYARYIKRFLDIVISFTALVLLSPILVLLTVLGAIAMKGNPFFVQKRPGLINKKTGKEKIISLLKFRTMSNERDADGNLLPDKQRLNKYGRFLRSTSCDELPALLNMFVGDISLVGPRPLLVKYLDYYDENERQRHSVRPGFTGWAQVNGRNALEWGSRFQKDIEYVNGISFAMDVKIIFMTVRKVLKRENVEFKCKEPIMEYFERRAREKEETAERIG